VVINRKVDKSLGATCTVRPYIHRPPQNFFFTVLQSSPLTGTSRRVQRVQAGLGLGVQGQGQAELGLGGQKVLGRLPDHSSLALLKDFNFRYCPTSARFSNK